MVPPSSQDEALSRYSVSGEEIIITLTAGQTGYSNKDALVIEFGTDDTYSDYKTTMSTVKGQAEYVITPDSQEYTYVRITHNISYTVYVASIEYVYVQGPEVVATFDFGANGSASHVDGNDLGSSKSYTAGDYTLKLTSMSKVYGPAKDAKGNSCIKLGTSKVVGTLTFTVDEEVQKVVIYVAKYKVNTSKINVNGQTYTLTKNSNNGEYDVIEIDTSEVKKITFSTVSGGVRCMINTIEYWA